MSSIARAGRGIGRWPAGGAVLGLLLAGRTAHALEVEVETLRDSGPVDRRINIVVLGDGYRTEDQSQLTSDAGGLINHLFGISPPQNYAQFFNVKLVHVISNENGADFGDYGESRDTALGSAFNCSGVDGTALHRHGHGLERCRQPRARARSPLATSLTTTQTTVPSASARVDRPSPPAGVATARSNGSTSTAAPRWPAFGLVAAGNARPLVPARYELAGDEENAMVVVRVVDCKAVSIDGGPAHSATVSQVGISLVEDAGGPGPDATADINNYTLWYATNEPGLARSLRGAGVDARYDRQLRYRLRTTEAPVPSSPADAVLSIVARRPRAAAFSARGRAVLPGWLRDGREGCSSFGSYVTLLKPYPAVPSSRRFELPCCRALGLDDSSARKPLRVAS